MNTTQQVVILSAERSELNNESNRQRTENLAACISDLAIRAKKAKGVFNGESEDAFVCIVKNQAEVEALKNFAFNNFDQDAILYQDGNQQAYLILKDNTEKHLGKLQKVDSAEGLKNYTILNNDIYATAKQS